MVLLHCQLGVKNDANLWAFRFPQLARGSYVWCCEGGRVLMIIGEGSCKETWVVVLSR